MWGRSPCLRVNVDAVNVVNVPRFPRDYNSAREFKVEVRCRRMGEDNGMDQLIRVSNYFGQIGGYVRSISRKLGEEEQAKVAEILAGD
jgi:hypothetical protein